ncbi:MFS transporter [Streptomyces pristinaespiralis]|uniref:MFS transporter n=1 Tax=Streptomyces pristinaespiralis TaxID=38300 RepID=UPI0033C359B2
MRTVGFGAGFAHLGGVAGASRWNPAPSAAPRAGGFGGIATHDVCRYIARHGAGRRGSALLVTPLSSHLARRHGARLTLAVGTVITLAAYALRGFLSPSAGMVISWTTLASIGIAIGYGTLPLLIIADIEPHETAAANGLNALLRAVGTAVASAFVAAIGTTLATGTGASTQPSWEAIATVFAVGSVLSVVTFVFALATQGRTTPASRKTALHRPPPLRGHRRPTHLHRHHHRNRHRLREPVRDRWRLHALTPAAGWRAGVERRGGSRARGVDVADRRVEVLVVEPVDLPQPFGRGCPRRGGEFATAAGPATRTEPAVGCSPYRGQPLTVMFELPLLW